MLVVLKRLSLGVALILLAAAVLLISDVGRRTPGARSLIRLAIVQHASQPIIEEGVQGMLDGLRQNGFIAGQTIAVQRFNAEGDMATANTIAKAVSGGDYDMILTATTISLQTVVNANSAGKTRHVFALVSDPFGAGVGISRDNPLKHPRHLVGYGTMQPVAETFRVARQMFPALQTVGVVWNPAEANSEANVKLARSVCNDAGLRLIETNADNSSGVVEAANALIARGIEALWVGGDVTVLTAIDGVAAAARTAHIPVFTSMPGTTARGALFDVGANYHEVGRLGGELAARVLKGADPASIAIVNVMPETLLINRQALAGLKEPWTIPDELERAARFIGETPAATPTPAALAKKWNLHVLEYVNVPDVEDGEHGLRAGLQQAGLVEGRDYTLTLRNAQGDMPTLSTLVDAALSDGADLLLTFSTPTLQAAMQRARQLPIVFTFTANPIAAGAGRSNEDHLPNVTGVSSGSAYRQMLDVVQECLPHAKRLGTVLVPAEVNQVYSKDQVAQLAAERGLELVVVPANTSAEVSDATLSLLTHQLDAIVQLGGNVTSVAFTSIARPAQRAKVPVFAFLSGDLKNGAAVVIARDYFDGGRQAGQMASRVMRGESPANIPFEPLSITRVLLNLDAARAAGLEIPAALRQRADLVIGQQ
jgi:ABC-type uncharacterized transport system substrate-binding protein